MNERGMLAKRHGWRWGASAAVFLLAASAMAGGDARNSKSHGTETATGGEASGAASLPVVNGAVHAATGNAPAARAVAPAVKQDTNGGSAQTKTTEPRRDPFRPLLTRKGAGENGTPLMLPPGKAGLMANTVQLQGVLQTPGGMIAVVANPQQHVYFLHPGDKIYDGKVKEIRLDGIVFDENSHDAFGHPMQRIVTVPLSPMTGVNR
jgi:hypothetical protein